MVRHLKEDERRKLDDQLYSRPGGPPPGFEDEASLAEQNMAALRGLKR